MRERACMYLCANLLNERVCAACIYHCSMFICADAIIINYRVLIFICQFIQCHVAATLCMCYCCYAIVVAHASSKCPKSKNRHYLPKRFAFYALNPTVRAIFRISFICFRYTTLTISKYKYKHPTNIQQNHKKTPHAQTHKACNMLQCTKGSLSVSQVS